MERRRQREPSRAAAALRGLVRACGLLLLTLPAFAAELPRCLYVSSYHAGNEWNDEIERAAAAVLEGRCELKRFYMDGRRHLDQAFAEAKAREAKDLIDAWRPAVVIAADDNASKYLVMPYLRDARMPVVFCGVNWTGEPYGYPYRNTTGMIEIGPIEPLMQEVLDVVRKPEHGVFLSVDELTQYKEFAASEEFYAQQGVRLSHVAVRTMAEWEAAYAAAQAAEFVILGNAIGIEGWDLERARRHVEAHVRRFTVSYLEWLAPLSMLTMAKSAAEQGEWAGKAARLILDGTPPDRIPVVANRRWNTYVNQRLLEIAGVRLSPDIVRTGTPID